MTTVHCLLPLLMAGIAVIAYEATDRVNRIKDRWANMLIQLESIRIILH